MTGPHPQVSCPLICQNHLTALVWYLCCPKSSPQSRLLTIKSAFGHSLKTMSSSQLRSNQCFLGINFFYFKLCSLFLVSSLSRIYAIPLQPTYHAHTEQHATHLDSISCHSEPAAATASSNCSSDGSAACVAVAAVGEI